MLQYDDIDTNGGQSGSAIYTLIDGELAIVGVHTHDHIDFNEGTASTSATLDCIRRVLADN